MAGGMAGPAEKGGLMRWCAHRAILVAAVVACGAGLASAQNATAVAPLPKECVGPANATPASVPLPNVAAALKARKTLNILAIGGTSASLRGPVSGGHYATVERFLEQTFKGLDVEIVHRGVSGELAADAAERIKNEVALTKADLVLWQLGTADALARVPIDDFKTSVSETLQWLKEHKVDVILVGMRYTRVIARDPQYQKTRQVVELTAKQQNVLRINRYEAEEALAKLRKNQGVDLPEVEVTDSNYACIAEYVARAIVAGLFVKDRPPAHGAGAPPPGKAPGPSTAPAPRK